ncbi:DUF986 family protein [Thermoactinomyces mirandus]|uniref:UPF0266 membrane protein YobD n=1 Tax=Thermoactinomyces mirandus TaxID=2756294 RepID=A0A7W1XV48_9BACL|nr:DUF986 family protein [Thermoactinomyces mirandus]MBA4603867.1 DUF986 family protein [Thermoactinomyces mirandus]
MSITSIVLLIFIVLIAGYLIYESTIIPFLKGKTRLVILLRKRLLGDQLIFAGLLIILYISNYVRGVKGWDNYLLLVLTVLFIFYVFIRSPKAHFKDKGFFYGLFYTEYDKIKDMRLSEDGVLVIDTDRRRLMLFARRIEDLESILKHLVEH